MKNFYDLLAGCNAAEHSFSKRSFFNTPNESFGDLKIDISFEQSQPHMAQCGIDVRFADRAMTTQLFANVLKFVRKLGKHDDKKLNIAPRHFRVAQALRMLASSSARAATTILYC